MTFNGGLIAMLGFVLALAGALAPLPNPPHPSLWPDTTTGVERNVVFGMYSGLAVLMDVYSPSVPNGRGVVLIGGSGWHSNRGYRAGQKKAGVEERAIALADAGFRVFAINHREAPRFHWPSARDDAQRAVRWVRHHANRYGIDPEQIGVMGESSGAHLAGLLGTINGGGEPDSPDPVERESSRVQAVVLFSPATDLEAYSYEPRVVAMMGHTVVADDGRDAYVDASPIRHVSSDDPPFFIVHGAEDQVVPVEQATSMADALRQAGVEVQLTVVPTGDHDSDLGATDRAIRWLAEKLVESDWTQALGSLEEARRILEHAESLAVEGAIEQAIAEYQRSESTDPRITVSAASWNVLCRSGGLHGAAALVLSACDRAIALQPENGRWHDSRGLVRAVTGNVRGAIKDFRVFVDWEPFGIQGRPWVSEAERQRRQAWIQALESGKDPFTEEVLASLRVRE